MSHSMQASWNLTHNPARYASSNMNPLHTQTLPSMNLQVSGHGNFGSLDDDPAAAMRYTECRLQSVAEDALLADLGRATVDWVPTFDASQVRPNPRCLQVLAWSPAHDVFPLLCQACTLSFHPPGVLS